MSPIATRKSKVARSLRTTLSGRYGTLKHGEKRLPAFSVKWCNPNRLEPIVLVCGPVCLLANYSKQKILRANWPVGENAHAAKIFGLCSSAVKPQRRCFKPDEPRHSILAP